MTILSCEDVSKHFKDTVAVKGVSLALGAAESIGIVGESGSGKSTLANILGGLIPPTSGTVYFDGEKISDMKKTDYMNFRQNVQFVFQSPKESLHPYLKVRTSLREPFYAKGRRRTLKKEIDSQILRALERVQLNESVLDKYPHQLSGGQAQRVSIVRAMITDPKVVIFDEAVSALDILVQREVIEILKKLRQNIRTSYLFITHDISTVQSLTDRIIVMKDGRIVEIGKTEDVLNDPQNSYTKKLIESAI
ncbi:ABC transporter ATP-binding protein [Phocicoccus pinnipedialis]|uniref:Oligopeptide transport ATP-binding protein OppF n=1 Tax=Phocicoccus pinnipedialis TaxID=110845 RepID=A0A6V7R4P5_9BACL|nr:ABC transporter ATP-binding protein [Jeotgalicoccus pinnipedialis]MBP1939674.1 peptide/nickel transport system ATP-binding protein [Jeotgalicoccus pinnipedialis]CAD2072296.1 Oligopeptide transport ATP-binding protein OppF [Jeotgalicoccus pinnipedialis]